MEKRYQEHQHSPHVHDCQLIHTSAFATILQKVDRVTEDNGMQRMTEASVVNGAFVGPSQRRHARPSSTSHRGGNHRPHRQLLRHEHLAPSARTGRQDSLRKPGIAPPTNIDDVPRQPPQKRSPSLIAAHSTRPIQDIHLVGEISLQNYLM
ncbi:hypothetical protein LAZ67_4002835 [Cordylochernes scorpioides]|uniref:Uncharacterized protein n=1 Tax=Cordylochernes scorpioides TaxID=51811 RepID=A0ABY6KG67_9ARAC|nr:hypothetical protein LAZ67_4002835 [Cordylochernes scorpioides]